jgi:hypothetical protein
MRGKSVVLTVLTFCFTLIGFSHSVLAGPGDNCASEPSGAEFVLRGQPTTYQVNWALVLKWLGQPVPFWNSDGHSGVSDLKLGGGGLKAEENMTFTTRGLRTAYAAPPWISGAFMCNEVWVSDAPSISKVSFSKTTRTIVVDYAVDEYSKAGKTSTPVTISFKWRSDFYGRTGSLGSQTTSSLTGRVTKKFAVPATRDLYHISATVSDGKRSRTIPVGSYLQRSGPGGGRPL